MIFMKTYFGLYEINTYSALSLWHSWSTIVLDLLVICGDINSALETIVGLRNRKLSLFTIFWLVFLYKFRLNQNTTTLFRLKLTFLLPFCSNIEGHYPTKQMKPKKKKRDQIACSLPQWMHTRNRVIEREGKNNNKRKKILFLKAILLFIETIFFFECFLFKIRKYLKLKIGKKNKIF